MREKVEAVISELKRLKSQGVDGVYLRDVTMNGFKEAVSGVVVKTTPSEIRAPKPRVAPQLTVEESSSPTAKPEQGTAPAAVKAKAMHWGKIAPIPEPTAIELPEGNKMEQWTWLRDRVFNCPVCNEHVKPGKHVVFGVGSVDADIFFCGEAPGAEEEVQQEPFVGPAGQLLTKIIAAMGLTRSDVYIGNIMNWRPELPSAVGNRPPTTEEMRFCLPHLEAQLEIIKPKVIVALGNTAVTGLLGEDPNRRMGSVRGRWFEFNGIPLMITYHPSYLLRNGSMRVKRTVWEDMMQVMDKVGLSISEKQRGYFL